MKCVVVAVAAVVESGNFVEISVVVAGFAPHELLLLARPEISINE